MKLYSDICNGTSREYYSLCVYNVLSIHVSTMKVQQIEVSLIQRLQNLFKSVMEDPSL